MHVIAGKAVCFKEALSPEFKEYQNQIIKNAKVLAEELMKKDFKLVSGGTDNHLILVDLTNKSITGKEAEEMLDEVGITVNKNAIPFDKQKPNITSGIRIGTPAMTTRGMKEEEMERIAEFINDAINGKDKEVLRKEVLKLTAKFPIY